jgi:error-prone DNA polymerase
MTANGITGSVQDEIIQSITSFALYGFPESHAASFALIAYASAYLKCHHLAAFTAAILNNQPMGFYSPATLVKDAQRHGLKTRPIDVARSGWNCTLEETGGESQIRNPKYQIGRLLSVELTLRIGLRYVRGLRESAGRAIVRARTERPFASIDDLILRVPELSKSDLVQLAEIGALNFIDPAHHKHRRDALWQVERAAQRTGPLLEKLEPEEASSPLDMMTAEERLVADFGGTGMTLGPHPMAYCREELQPQGVLRAIDLARLPNGRHVRVAGCVIARQRPGTAKGFVFLSLEDETGIANIIVTPDVLDRYRATIIQGKFLLFEGALQNIDNVIHVKAARVEEIAILHAAPPSRDFH